MTKFVDSLGLKRLVTKIAEAVSNGTWLPVKAGRDTDGNVVEGAVVEGGETMATGACAHAEGGSTIASGLYAHAEGFRTAAIGIGSHAQGISNSNNLSFIDTVGVGNTRVVKNASVIYVERDAEGLPTPTAPKNGYQYLLNVGGYKGQAIAEGMKSVQEVIADLEKGVEAASETMTVEDIKEIMGA